MTTTAKPPTTSGISHLAFTFFDPFGAEIAGDILPVPDALRRIADFIEIHGTDPECEGQGAQSGSVLFYPTTGEEPYTPSRNPRNPQL